MRKSSSITRLIEFSFPGIAEAEIIILSPAVISTCLCSPKAILCRADIVSPWLPVVIITVFSFGRPLIWFMSTKTPF